ncbi:6,7-dimethyl-8-ribityllumazine synthase, partial [Escherichia coli]
MHDLPARKGSSARNIMLRSAPRRGHTRTRRK